MIRLIKRCVEAVLRVEARAALRRHTPTVVAVVGAVGKTTTKDAVYEVLAALGTARKSAKSFNSDIGVPLSVLGLENPWNSPVRWLGVILKGAFIGFLSRKFPERIVLEVGADNPGDIKRLAAWLTLDVVVITRWGDVPVHVEQFASPEELKDEDRSIITSLKPSGTLVLNADDTEVAITADRFNGRVITYGMNETAVVRGTEVSVTYSDSFGRGIPSGMSAAVVGDGVSALVSITGSLGSHHISPLLAAVAVGKALGAELPVATAALADFVPPRGRMNIIEGISDSVIIDDTYNSSPVAAEAALSALATLTVTGKRIAILGDMRELGDFSMAEHERIGRLAHDCFIDTLVCIGDRGTFIGDGALAAGMSEERIIRLASSVEAGERLAPLIEKGDVVLVKGSQGMRMERTVKRLMAQPERAASLLVRQEAEWQVR